LLVPERDEIALAEAILRLLEDPALANRLGEAGARFAIQHFDWDRITDETEQLYASVLGSSRQPAPQPSPATSI
jgi:alpha-maltose-1-phosphate synthase